MGAFIIGLFGCNLDDRNTIFLIDVNRSNLIRYDFIYVFFFRPYPVDKVNGSILVLA